MTRSLSTSHAGNDRDADSVHLEEGRNGAILNAKTGKPFDLNDPCVEKGPQVAYHRAAREATIKAVKEFLVTTFRIPTP